MLKDGLSSSKYTIHYISWGILLSLFQKIQKILKTTPKGVSGSSFGTWMVNSMISWRTVEDGAGFGKMKAGPPYKSTSFARLCTTILSMA